jgi:IstB-like ATP binding protein
MPTAAVALNRLHAQLRPHSSSSKAAMREYHLAGGSRRPPPPDGGSGPLLRRSSHTEDGTDNKFAPQLSDTRHYASASTGVGKTWIACALGHRACRDNRSVLYQRVPRMLEGLGLARGDGRYARMLKSLARVQVLILDDWGLTPLAAEQRRDLLEIIDDRHGRTSTVVTSQLPIDNWHAHIGDPTIADAVLDRLVHNAHRLELKGESLRKLRTAKNAKLDDAIAN